MDFVQAAQARRNADARKLNGTITAEQYASEINAIRIKDARGCWWQPDPCGPGWICWDGKQWIAGTPPAAGAAAAPYAGSPGSAPAGTGGTAPAAVGTPAKKKPEVYSFRPVPDTEPGWKLMSLAEWMAILKTTPWRKRPRKWWDLFSILLGCTLAIVWFLYSSLNPWSEAWDLVTPALMIVIPCTLVCCRKPIDDLLMPLQPHRAKFPHLLLLAIGICVPFLTAWVLYNIVHITQYDLIRYNMVLGTCIAYSITRDPVLAKGYTQPPRSLRAPVALFIGLAFLIQAVRGDDCASSIMNANDCLRTDGYSETITGTAAAAEAAANAAGDEASDPSYQKDLKDWLDTLEPNTWTKRGSTEYMVDDNGIVHVRPAQDGGGTTPAGDSSTGTDRLPAGTYESTTVNEDGSTTTTTTFPDNKTMTTTTSADGSSQTTTTTYPNGNTVTDQTTHNPDGSTTSTTTYPDGSQSTTVSDGAGNSVTKNTDGSVTVRNRDGTSSTTVTYDDGAKMTTYDDGRTVTQETDGTTTTTVTNPDGSKTVTTDYPDGTTDSHTTGGPEEPGGDEGEGGIGGEENGGSGDGGFGIGETK